MNIDWVVVLGFFSAFCTTIAFIPQVYKIWKSKSAKDISFLAFAVFICGVIGWLVYGILNDDLPLIFANFITFILAIMILIGIIKYK